MIKQNNKDFEMQVYLRTCEENGIILAKPNSKIKPNIILVAENGTKYSVSEDMSVSAINRPARRKILMNVKFRRAISRRSK